MEGVKGWGGKEAEMTRERVDEWRENSTLDEFDICVYFAGRGVLPVLLSVSGSPTTVQLLRDHQYLGDLYLYSRNTWQVLPNLSSLVHILQFAVSRWQIPHKYFIKYLKNTPEIPQKYLKNTPQLPHKYPTNTPQIPHKYPTNTPQSRNEYFYVPLETSTVLQNSYLEKWQFGSVVEGGTDGGLQRDRNCLL